MFRELRWRRWWYRYDYDGLNLSCVARDSFNILPARSYGIIINLSPCQFSHWFTYLINTVTEHLTCSSIYENHKANLNTIAHTRHTSCCSFSQRTYQRLTRLWYNPLDQSCICLTVRWRGICSSSINITRMAFSKERIPRQGRWSRINRYCLNRRRIKHTHSVADYRSAHLTITITLTLTNVIRITTKIYWFFVTRVPPFHRILWNSAE